MSLWGGSARVGVQLWSMPPAHHQAHLAQLFCQALKRKPHAPCRTSISSRAVLFGFSLNLQAGSLLSCERFPLSRPGVALGRYQCRIVRFRFGIIAPV